MAKITLEGNAINTNGDLPAVGTTAPDFTLTAGDLSEKTLADFSGKKKVLNIVVSLDTGICEDSANEFNKAAQSRNDVVMLTISADLPFAQGRVCGDLDKMTTLSMMRNKNFAKDYGVLIQDGPLAGVCARAIVVLDEANKVLHSQLVPEIAQAPDYNAALAAL